MTIVALLGPTNTGKTYTAVERMLEHSTGMIGFPLRLLARENYDRIVAARGAESVALVTGEERIVPPTPRYYVCTVEAMPLEVRVDFLAVDEVQLAADRERGHVFTDRLLHARGAQETMFLGADTIRPILRRLVPGLDLVSRPRLSSLRYAAPRRIERLPRRSAVIAFSVGELYGIAERLRGEKGGASLVFGGLSPRTRNAQVALYQRGEVDYLVATDAIGMGLNLDVDHVAFTSLVKHDGVGPRPLRPAEVGQIAGRAGRHVRDGSFGATAELGPLAPELVEAVERHSFEPLKTVYWRHSRLSFASTAALLRSLERPPPQPWLQRARYADDQRALEILANDPEVVERTYTSENVRLLWDVCQVPDFRNVLSEGHTRLLARLFVLLADTGMLPDDWVERQVRGLESSEGDIATLLDRISGIRTWTYVSHRPGWLADPETWQVRTRQIEDRLSDALHDRLREEFVSRGATLVARQDPLGLQAEIAEDGTLTLQGVPAGRLLGFRFEPLPGDASRALRAAANRVLRAGIDARVAELADAGDDAFGIGAEGAILWRGGAVGRLLATDRLLAPQVDVLSSDLLDPPRRERVRRRLSEWLAARLRCVLGPLLEALEAPSPGPVRAIVYGLAESLGSQARRNLRSTLATIGPDRQELSRLAIVVGRRHVFMPALLSADALRTRATLWRVRHPESAPLAVGPPWVRASGAPDPRRDAACGYERLGGLLVRVDAVERLLGAAHHHEREGRLRASDSLAGLLRCDEESLPGILTDLGFVREGDVYRARRPQRGPSNGHQGVH